MLGFVELMEGCQALEVLVRPHEPPAATLDRRRTARDRALAQLAKLRAVNFDSSRAMP